MGTIESLFDDDTGTSCSLGKMVVGDAAAVSGSGFDVVAGDEVLGTSGGILVVASVGTDSGEGTRGLALGAEVFACGCVDFVAELVELWESESESEPEL